MAYVAQTTEDPLNKKVIDLSDNSSGAAGAGGTGSAAVTGVGPSDNFVGIGDYQAANQQGAEKLGTDVSSTIGSKIDTANTAIQSGAQQFNQAAEANRVNYNPTAVQNTINTGQADADFNKLISGTYAGPKTWTEAGITPGVDTAVQNAQEQAQLAGTQGGRVELLRQISQGRPQTLGAVNLNSALLSGNENAAANLRTAAARATPLAGNVLNAENAATTTAGQIAANNVGVKNQAIGALTGYLGEQDQAQAQRLAQAQAEQAQKNTAAQAYLEKINKVTGVPEIMSARPLELTGGQLPVSQVNSVPSTTSLGNLGFNLARIFQNVGTTVTPEQTQATQQAITTALTPATAAPPVAELPAGWEALGLSQEQAQKLANAVLLANTTGAQGVSTNAYYTAPGALSKENVISAADASRLNALAQIAGAAGGYRSSAAGQGSYNLDSALSAIEAQRAAAQNESYNRAIAASAAQAAAAQTQAANAPAPVAAPISGVTPSSGNGGTNIGVNNGVNNGTSEVISSSPAAYDPTIGAPGPISNAIGSVFGYSGVDSDGNPSSGGISSPSAYGISPAAIGTAVSTAGSLLGLGPFSSLLGLAARLSGEYANQQDPTNPLGLNAVNGMDSMSNNYSGSGAGGFSGGSSSDSGPGTQAGRTNDRGGYGSSSDSDGGGSSSSGGSSGGDD